MILTAAIICIASISILCIGYVLYLGIVRPIWQTWKARHREMAVYRPSTYFQSGRIIR